VFRLEKRGGKRILEYSEVELYFNHYIVIQLHQRKEIYSGMSNHPITVNRSIINQKPCELINSDA